MGKKRKKLRDALPSEQNGAVENVFPAGKSRKKKSRKARQRRKKRENNEGGAEAACYYNDGPCLSFEIALSLTMTSTCCPLEHVELTQLTRPDDESVLLQSCFCDEHSIRELWGQKGRLSQVFNSKMHDIYHSVREEMYPNNRSGSDNGYCSRAGDKLGQVAREVGLFDGLDSVCFIDVCGAPGGFSQVVLHSYPPGSAHGYGISLTESEDCHWCTELQRHPSFVLVDGPSCDGDVYKPENLDAVLAALTMQSDHKRVNLVLADGEPVLECFMRGLWL
jgi:hypothetical protein